MGALVCLFYFMKSGNKKFIKILEGELKNVKLGIKVGGMWMVENGLKPGETIVFEGLNLVRPGTKVQTEKVEIPQELKNF